MNVEHKPDGYIIKDVAWEGDGAAADLMVCKGDGNSNFVVELRRDVSAPILLTNDQAMKLVYCLTEILGGAYPETKKLLDSTELLTAAMGASK